MNTAIPIGNRHTVTVPKTAELVANRIRRQIVSGQVHQGEALPNERALMERFAISRPTLREAFRILESEGLIIIRRGAHGSARVLEPSVEVAARYVGLVLQHRDTKVADVLESRVIVEAPAARMLAERRDRVSVANRLQAYVDSVDALDPDSYREFNGLVVELTGNQTMMLLTAMLEHIGHIAALTYTSRPQTDNDVRLGRKAQRTRQKLIDLIRAGDGDGAEALWHSHLRGAGDELMAGIGERLVDLFGTSP